SVCGNGVCEQYETCTNCPDDCGNCTPIGCIEIVTCAFGCIDLTANPPEFSFTCVADCTSQGCADVQFFVDQVINCAVGALFTGCADLTCIQDECSSQLAACIGATCS